MQALPAVESHPQDSIISWVEKNIVDPTSKQALLKSLQEPIEISPSISAGPIFTPFFSLLENPALLLPSHITDSPFLEPHSPLPISSLHEPIQLELFPELTPK
jgi:hypothetical protein